ncbi:unnamed protein product [Caenorhabditis nigoni]
MPAGPIAVSDVIRFISDRIGDYDKPESLAKWCQKAMKDYSPRSLNCMQASVSNRLKRIEKLDGYSLMEKLQLVFIFSQPVSDGFVQLLKDAKFEISQDNKKSISRFSTEDGSIVRFSDHHRDVKYFNGVLCLNSALQKKANKHRIAREKKQGQQDVEYENSNIDAALIKEQRVENIPVEPKREGIRKEVEKEAVEDIPSEKETKQEVDEDMTVGGDIGQVAFSGRINYEELDAQKFVYPGFPEELKPVTSIRIKKRRHNSTADSGKRVKTEEMSTEAASSDSIATSSNQKTPTTSSNTPMQQSPQEARPAIPTPDEPKISVLALATHIENIAAHYNLENLEKKASLAVEKMNKTGDKTLSIKKLNLSISFMLLCLEENRICDAEDLITLKSLFKQLRSFLIRPLGPRIVHEALESIDQKIREFENKEDGVPPNIISESLTHLLMATGF